MKLIVDIDGTICTPTDGEYGIAQPYGDRIATLNRLYDEGHEVHYWTARGSSSGKDWTNLTQMQLELWGCRYTSLRLGKPSYDAWVDDKAFSPGDFFGRS